MRGCPGVATRFGLMALAVLASGCRCLPGSTPGATVLDLPPIRQAPDRCGPAALHAVYRYWGRNEAEAEVAARIFSPEAAGTLPGMLVADARRQGFEAAIGDADPVQWARALASGVAVICLWPGPAGHFVVLQGQDGDRFLVNDGSGRLRWTSRRELPRPGLSIYVWPGDYAFDPPPGPVP